MELRIIRNIKTVKHREIITDIQIVITSPKTQTSNRIVPLSERMYKMLIALSPKEKASFFLSGNNYPIEVSKSYAYKIVQKLNAELAEKGYMVISGRVNKQYFMERTCYGADKKER